METTTAVTMTRHNQEPRRGLLQMITIEPVMFIYMCSTFIKFPVFQSLLYEKACLEKYFMDFERCSDVSAVHADVDLQQRANHLLMISTLFLMVPSIFSSLLLGSLCDVWSIKSTMLIPFIGLLFADVNYIVQCLFMGSNAYFLILSDIVFGLTGGFNAIIGILFAYSVKANKTSVRSERVALLEGIIGLGSTIGSIFSGFIRQKIGYTWIFVIITVMHVLAIGYILFFVKDLNATNSEQSSQEEQAVPVGLRQSISRRIREIGNVYCGRERDPKTQRFLNLVLIALAIELIGFAGLMDILFSYLRYQFKWTDKEYGWFSGTGSALGSLTVIFVYPFLHKGIGLSNAILAIIGLVSKMSNLVILVLASSNWVAALSVIPLAFSRFISTGLRSMASFYVKNHEQGKIFSFIALLEGVSFLIASFIFNGIYPLTLNFFPGTMLLGVAGALLIPVIFLIYIQMNNGHPTTEEPERDSLAA